MKKLMNVDEADCGLHVAFAVVGGKWKPLILYYLRRGPRWRGQI